MNFLGLCLAAVGLVLLLHSIFSAVEHREYIRLMETEQGLPMDIQIECIVAVAIFIVGAGIVGTNFVPIKLTEKFARKTSDMIMARSEFSLFNTRGRVLGEIRKAKKN
eukprot:CAMPEP_0177686026 /NCGR_PEP_ID=MMETSP0447-20121125/33343_1 /TAXON_ID=0 /ORGANISM="Stygamoeba regulata, Strain BSH-02190019" /LENGTH=107 /DNA_ID=CAMNT_0019196109 /DNA_START=89 /DNA_END=412 /DNA_ORIENTATION=+